MDTKQSGVLGSFAPWKRLIIRAFAWGVGFGLALLLVLLSVYSYTQRPKQWDTHGLRVKNAEARSLTRLSDKLEEVSVGTIFNVDLENTTGADITLPQTVRVMQATKQTGALHGSLLKLDNDYFIPAHHVVTVSLANDDLCPAKTDGKECLDRYFQEAAEIILFDEAPKYEIHIPIPSYTAPKSHIGLPGPNGP
jgi:hypothetical protein